MFLRLEAPHSRGVMLSIGAVLLVSFVGGGWIRVEGPPDPDREQGSEFWQVGRPAAIAVHGGRATFRVPAPKPAFETLVVVSALARSRGPFPIELLVRDASRASRPSLAHDGPRRPPRRDHRPASSDGGPGEPVRGLPPRERAFHIMVRDGDPASQSNYAPIRGVLKGVGRRAAVYVASDDVQEVDPNTVADVIVAFDDRIYPVAAGQFGPARDVDSDGRFTILFSSWLGRLGGGRYAVDGVVRVADLDSTFAPPFGNRCDMMYLNTSLKAGPHLRTILAHEYMHAVIFSQKTLRGSGQLRERIEEEGWLDEAMAHLAEDLHGFSTSNIDYRISAFLSQPESYELVVDDYYAADLFRSHGNRGSTYLFLRWCADRYGSGLLPALVQSRCCGIASLEAATGSTFPDLFRRWSLALYRSGLVTGPASPDTKDDDGFLSLKMRGRNEEWELAGPRCARLGPGGAPHRWKAVGTSAHFVVVDGSRRGALEIEVAGPAEAELQVTALPLGADLARLELSLQKSHDRAGDLCVRARVRELHGVPVRLTALSWEPLSPSPDPHAAGFRCGRLDTPGIASSFGTSAVPAFGELFSQPILLATGSAQSGPIVVKVVGTDHKGRHVSAWAQLDTTTDSDSSEP